MPLDMLLFERRDTGHDGGTSVNTLTYKLVRFFLLERLAHV